MKIEHPFLATCYDLEDLVSGNQVIEDFVKKLKKQSKLHEERHDSNTYLGDGFEMLIEALIKLSPVDNRIGISNYQNAPYGKAGIDGFGTGLNGRPATVQVKFKSDHEYLLTETKDNIAGFPAVSVQRPYNVHPDDFATNLLVVTYGSGLHNKTKEHFFPNGVEVINRAGLMKLVDNNVAFWDALYDLTKHRF